MDIFLKQLIERGHLIPPEIISIVVAVCAVSCIFIANKYFGVIGLHVYNSLAICIANIQILHLTQITCADVQVPLGTVLFTTMFLANALITNLHGTQEARKSVWLAAVAYLFFSVHMLLSLAHAPAQQPDEFCLQAMDKYKALLEVFIPSLRIIFASVIAYILSQLFHICFVKYLPYAFFRQYCLTLLSSMVDHVVFTLFAFYIFSAVKPTLHVFIGGYVVGSFIIRLVTIAICTMSAFCYSLRYQKTLPPPDFSGKKQKM